MSRLPRPLESEFYLRDPGLIDKVNKRMDAVESAIIFISKIFKRHDIATSSDLVDTLKSLSGDKKLSFLKAICYKINGSQEKIANEDIRTGHSIALVIPPHDAKKDFTELFDSVLEKFNESRASDSAAMIFLLLNFYHVLPDGNGRSSRLLYEIFNKTNHNSESLNDLKLNVVSRPDGLNEILCKLAEAAVQELFIDAHLIKDGESAEIVSRELAETLTGKTDRSNGYTGSTDWERFPQHTGDTRRLELLAMVFGYFDTVFYETPDSLPNLDIYSLEFLKKIKNKGLDTDIGLTDYQYYKDVFKLFIIKILSFFDSDSKHLNLIQNLKDTLESQGDKRLISKD